MVHVVGLRGRSVAGLFRHGRSVVAHDCTRFLIPAVGESPSESMAFEYTDDNGE